MGGGRGGPAPSTTPHGPADRRSAISRTDLFAPDAALVAALEEAAPGAVAARASDRLSFAHDASHYLLVPQAVVAPRDAGQVAALLRAGAAQGVGLTFRSGGTSLSGQATNNGVLVDTRRHFREVEVQGDGARVRVRVQPGATVRAVNTRLARYGRTLGPDPASESACTIGGVVANNSSGMACGTELNTYRTLVSAVLVLHFPSCTSTVFGPAGGLGVQDAFLALCERAGVEVRVPEGIASLCCGTPWKSKGLTDGYAEVRRRVVPVLREVTGGGALPVVVDASSCTEGLALLLAEEGVEVLDAVAFVEAAVLPHLPAAARLPSLVVHRTCSSTQLGLDAAHLRVAAAAEEVVEPEDWGCCAFAGDQGLLHPELTASATAAEARAVARHPAAAHASVNRTCELGMTRATGRPYRHVLEVLEEATGPSPARPGPEDGRWPPGGLSRAGSRCR